MKCTTKPKRMLATRRLSTVELQYLNDAKPDERLNNLRFLEYDMCVLFCTVNHTRCRSE
jgi:hypothetical protein